MTSGIIDGVCKRLSEEFGENYKIYTESVEQGFTEPCFFVSATSVEMTKMLGNIERGRYNRKQGVNVVFYPKQGDDVRNEVYSAAERVMDVLEYIEFDGLTRGSEIACEFVGDSPDIFASVNVMYEFTVYKQSGEDTALMETLSNNITGG